MTARLYGIRHFENKESVASQPTPNGTFTQLNVFMPHTVLQSIIRNGKANNVYCWFKVQYHPQQSLASNQTFSRIGRANQTAFSFTGTFV
jgi:hypothetical protein